MCDREKQEKLLKILGDEFRPYLEMLPPAIALELLWGDSSFITANQVTPALAARFRPHHRAMSTPDILRDILAPTAFASTRFQPLYGNLGFVRSIQQPGYGYFPYIPLNFMLQPAASAPLIVAVHGSSRNAKEQRDAFSSFAEEHGCFVLAPLFPIEMDKEIPDEEYKYVAGGRVRYDRVLFDMIAELSRYVGVAFNRTFYFGFSGGAQFCHRLFYGHADRMDLLAVAAPGFTTLPWSEHDWWVGIKDIDTIFGHPVDIAAMAQTPVLLLCGENDRAPAEVYSRIELGLSEAEYEDYGRDRVQRIKALYREWCRLDLSPRLEFISGSGHDFRGELHTRVRSFMAGHL